MDEARLQFKDQLRQLEIEQESILTMIGSEIDAACEIFSRDSMEKFKVILSFKHAADFVIFLMNVCSRICMCCCHLTGIDNVWTIGLWIFSWLQMHIARYWNEIL